MKLKKRVLAMTLATLALATSACGTAGTGAKATAQSGGNTAEHDEMYGGWGTPPLDHTAAPFYGISVSGGGTGVR